MKEIPLLWQQSFQGKKKGPWLPPLVSEEDVVEVVIDMQQLLRDLLVGHAGDELHDALLHGPAGPVQLLGDTCSPASLLGKLFSHAFSFGKMCTDS